jgi:hypothetical protein
LAGFIYNAWLMAATLMSQSPAAEGSLAQPEIRLDRRDALVLLLLLGGLLAVYAGAVLLNYAFLDDYSLLDGSLYDPQYIYEGLAAQGRPLNGLILRAAFQLAGGIGNLRWVRTATIVGVAVMGWMFYLAASRAGWGRPRAAMLAGIACVLPPMQVYVGWTTCIPVPIAGILSAAAAIITGWALDRPGRWPWLIVPPIFIAVSASIYQPMAVVFCPVAALAIFRPMEKSPDRSDLLRILHRGVVYAAVAGAGLFGGWGVFKYGSTRYATLLASDRNGFTHDPLGKITGFFNEPMVCSLNFIWLGASPLAAMVVAAIIIVGLCFYFRGGWIFRLSMLGIAVALAPMSYAPSLLAKTTEWCYRTQIGLVWMLLVLLWLAVNGLWRLARSSGIPIPAMAAVTIIAAMFAAYDTTALIACPQSVELSLFRTQLARPDVRAAQRIYLLMPSWGDSPTPIHRYDEFGVPSLMQIWVPVPEVHLIRCETDPHPPRLRVKRIQGFQGPWTAPLPKGSALIDMRVIRFAQ